MTQMHRPLATAGGINTRLYLPVFYRAVFCMMIFATILLAIQLWLTGGHFSLSLDDPYIHLALSEQILNGHYGINANEFSAPSSSILWPAIIAPLSLLAHADIGLWIFNLFLGVASLYVFYQLIKIQQTLGEALTSKQIFFYLILFILQANLLGLSAVGMEHQLQVLISAGIFYGLYQHVKTDYLPKWLGFVIIAAPLVRYESLAISASALFYLFFTGFRVYAIILGLLTVAGLAGFSVFLLSLGLDKFPDSVLVKSSTARGVSNLFDNLWVNLHFPKSIGLVFVMMLFLHTAWFKNIGKKHQCFYLALALAIGLHLVFGRTGWLFRYEIYIWVFAGLGLFCLYRQPLLPNEKPLWKRLSKGIMVLFVAIGILEHIAALVTTPIASSNIYHQQHQMAQLAKEYIKAPIAVNDLGAVSFNNDSYVLDLWGLGSSKARKLRHKGGVQWMDNLAQETGVKLVMIYQTDNWFPAVPDNWIKIGQLSDKTFRVISPYPVSFFAINHNALVDVTPSINDWQNALPSGINFTWQTDEYFEETATANGS